MRSKDDELRTQHYNVRVGDKAWIDGLPAFLVKGGGNKKDTYTIKEFLAAFYGEKCRCIIIDPDGGIIVIE